MSPGKSTPSQQEPAANSTPFSMVLNRRISSWECLHTSTMGNGRLSLKIWYTLPINV